MNRELRKHVTLKRNLLNGSDRTMAAVFDGMFHTRELILCEGTEDFRSYKLTYGQIHDRICNAAGALYEKLGAQGAYIALEMDNCPQWIVAFWAILMSGNKPYLVNLRYPQSLTEGILRTLEIRHVVCLKNSNLPLEVIPMDSLSGDHAAPPREVFADEFAISSSATSMKETICFYTGYQVSAQILKFESVVKECANIPRHYKGALKHLAFLPFYHIFGLFAVYFWYTYFGRTLVFLQDYAADTILKTCRRFHVTHIFAVPMLWHTVEKQLWSTVRREGEKKEAQLKKMLRFTTALQNICPGPGQWLARRLLKPVTSQLFGQSLTCCISGGSYLRQSAMELFNGLGYGLMNGFGMSEVGISSVELRSRPKYRNQNSIGHPFHNVEYRLDPQGVLEIRSDVLCIRKLVNGQEIVTPEWFSTGDIMTCDHTGHYFVKGRMGDVVIGENGENINPDMIEQLFVLEGAKQLSVLGLPGENGQELSLVIQLAPYVTEAVVSRIREEAYAINATLPDTSAVRKFYVTFQEMTPPTAIKVSRTQLLKKIESGELKLQTFQELRTQTAATGEESLLLGRIKAIIAQVLEKEAEEVGADDHIFYDLGGTSIQYFSILSALSVEFGVRAYDEGDSYRYTAREICEFVERYL